ncbi:unnamed protein product [Clonostachys rosea]|uniref:Rhodopsin domain-containing protein n=1 Tax=Bionectria ochroleuca TaxID=29856 RepID=A0ABY6UZ15_BIOOC|nr:unnamed protein product [Clonostachys rosea]
MDTSEAATGGSKQLELSLVAWIFTSLAIVTVFGKIYTTTFVLRRPGWDDLMIFLSLLASIVASGLIQASVDLGLGKHTAKVQAQPGGLAGMVMTKKLQILGYPFNILAYSLPNVAILILIERLVGHTETVSRAFLRGVVAVKLVLALVSVIIIFVQCQPTAYSWDQTIEGGKCWDPNVFNYTSYVVSAITAFTDLVLAVVPISAFWKLQMKLHQKIEMAVMLGLTLISAIFTVVKATYLPLFNDRVDPLYNVVILVIWGLIEQNVVIMAASIPTLRPLFRHIRKKGPFTTPTSYIRSGNNTKDRRTSVSEVPLEQMKVNVARGSRRSFEMHNSSDELHEEQRPQAAACWE